MQQSAYNAGYALGQAAVRGERDGQKSHSPSKATYQSGIWLGEGMINACHDIATKVMMVRMVPMAQMVKTEKVFLKYKLFIKLIIVRLESIHTPQVGVKLSQHRVLIQDICGHIKKPRTLMEVPKLPLLTLSDRMVKMVLIYHLLRYGSFCCNRIPTSCIKEATEKST